MSLLSVVIPAYNEGAMIHKTAEVVSSHFVGKQY